MTELYPGFVHVVCSAGGREIRFGDGRHGSGCLDSLSLVVSIGGRYFCVVMVDVNGHMFDRLSVVLFENKYLLGNHHLSLERE